MEEQPLLPPTENRVSRPNLLTVICILTFIGSGIYFFSSLMVFLFFNTFKAAAPEIAKIWKLPEMAEIFTNVSPFFFACMAGISLLAISGAVQMWKLHRMGFHIYAVAQILLIIAPMYFFRRPGPSIPDVLISGIFVMLYASNLKKMS
jgi:hypothetical protein